MSETTPAAGSLLPEALAAGEAAAMAKVIQAAGRVIRSETDRGLIVLLDDRFAERRFSSLMPRDWYRESVRELVSGAILRDVRDFWERSP